MQFIALKTTISMPLVILKDNQKRCKNTEGADTKGWDTER